MHHMSLLNLQLSKCYGQGINEYNVFIPATGIFFFVIKHYVWILKLQIWSFVIGIRYWLPSLPPSIQQDPAELYSIHLGKQMNVVQPAAAFGTVLLFRALSLRDWNICENSNGGASLSSLFICYFCFSACFRRARSWGERNTELLAAWLQGSRQNTCFHNLLWHLMGSGS